MVGDVVYMLVGAHWTETTVAEKDMQWMMDRCEVWQRKSVAVGSQGEATGLQGVYKSASDVRRVSFPLRNKYLSGHSSRERRRIVPSDRKDSSASIVAKNLRFYCVRILYRRVP